MEMLDEVQPLVRSDGWEGLALFRILQVIFHLLVSCYLKSQKQSKPFPPNTQCWKLNLDQT